jgi:hypothetical protein
MQKNAIVVLTRGYNNHLEYRTLISRNRHISVNFYARLQDPENYDVIIFHEGNITKEQQDYIQSQSPKLPLQFKSVQFYENNTKNYTLCPPTKTSESFSLGYKNMCYFWSINFLEYLKEYEYIIRVDEDCFIRNIPSDIIEKYTKNGIQFSSPYFQGPDSGQVIVGMHKLFRRFVYEKQLTPCKTTIQCPYTNIMIVNVQYFRNNSIVQEILGKIKECNCIFSNRWGDLPIWGYILTLLVEPEKYIEDKSISYWHGSHNKIINR